MMNPHQQDRLFDNVQDSILEESRTTDDEKTRDQATTPLSHTYTE